MEIYRNNLNSLIKLLNINVSKLSRYIGFDASYLSKIRNGTRTPQNINDFSNSIIKYITTYYNDNNSKELISKQLKYKKEELDNYNNFNTILKEWLYNNPIKN